MSYASKEQLKQILQKIDDNFARKDGYYTNMAVGNAENLISPDGVLDTPENDTEYNPFLFRTTAGDKSVSDGVATANKIRGRSYKWNQLVQNGNFESTSGWLQTGCNLSALNNELTISKNPTDGIQVFRHRPMVYGHKYFVTIDYNIPSEYQGNPFLNMSYLGWTQLPFNAKDDTWHTTHTVNAFNQESGQSTSPFIQSSGDVVGESFKVRNFMCVDITTIYGSGNEPTTADQFLADYPMFNSYVPYTEGSIAGVKATNIQTVGFNQWDEEWELGSIDASGQNVTSGSRIRGKNFDKCVANSSYYAKGAEIVYFYDANFNFISRVEPKLATGYVVTSPDNTAYFRIRMSDTYGATYKNDICINLSWSGYRNGEYEAYWKQSIATRISDYFTDGMHGVGSVYDELTSTRAIKRFGIVNLGTLSWTINGSGNNAFFSVSLSNVNNGAIQLNSKGYIDSGSITSGTTNDKAIHIYATGVSNLRIRDTAYTDATSFRDAMAGVYLIYELATPVETPIDPPINFNYRVSDFGTEEFTYGDGDVQVPVPCELFYQNNLVGKLRNINDLTASELEEVINGLG